MRPQSWLLLFLWMLGMPFAAGAWTLASDSDAPNPTPTPAVTTLTYEQHIRPILKTHCFQCHGEEDHREGKLDLRLRRLIIAGGESGPALVPNNPETSPLLKRIRAGEMPPKGKTVSAKELELIERWIAEGALTQRDEPVDVSQVGDITAEEKAFWSFQPIRRQPIPTLHQQRPDRAPIERSGETRQVANPLSEATPRMIERMIDQSFTPIDLFVAEKLLDKGLEFSPPADRQTMIRRLTFDLIGLPPTPAEVQDFLKDTAADAHERLIDRLLASPHYGERSGRQWLDVAGYADSEGYTEVDPIRKYSYKYRDWVIRAFNADLPFDQFVIEQLAGDELLKPPYVNLTPAQQDKLIATGFLRTVADGTGQGADPKVARNAVVAETIKVTSSALLGLTVGCAECHNHRYDPIPQADYYRLRAIFEPALNWKAWRNPAERLITLYTDADRTRSAAIEAEAQQILAERQKKLDAAIEVIFERELAKVPEEQRDRVKAARNTKDAERTPEQVALLKEFPSADPKPSQIDLYDPVATAELKKDDERAAAVRKQKPVEDFLGPLTEIPGQVPETVVFHRGDPDQPKQVVTPGELSVLDWLPPLVAATADSLPTSGRRLAYARHLTSGQHPLVSRVVVNRLWGGHFGKGLVATPGDFGTLGDRPTHPELLDWLAAEFVTGPAPSTPEITPRTPAESAPPTNLHRWSMKRLQRLLVSSCVYRQTSTRQATQEAVDPDNRYLARMPVRRLEAELVRDAILSINGTINQKLGGEPVPVMLDEDGQVVIGIENLNGENRPGPVIPLHGEEYRRSLYVQVRRSRPLAILDTFDLPTLDPNCTLRNSSTVAPQSLMLMNSDFILAAARQLAARLDQEHEAGSQPVDRIRFLWSVVFGRLPHETEQASALRFLEEQQTQLTTAAEGIADPKQKPDPRLWSWITFCQALLGSNEFLYID